MKKTITLIAAMAALAIGLLSGCSTTSADDRSLTKADVLTALEITAALTIGDDYKKAQTALHIVQDARRYIGEGETITADTAIDYIAKQALRSTSLTPAQQIAVRKFVERYRQNFSFETESIGLNPEIVVTISEALTAIEAVAIEIQTYGSATPRKYSIAQ